MEQYKKAMERARRSREISLFADVVEGLIDKHSFEPDRHPSTTPGKKDQTLTHLTGKVPIL
ncbi:hypothetical protein PTTG_27910 [Puccinia triticina 1-1 BBBD Race 1]|uniref:Uncharacterized protein n=2 Tax=Puccinia triticina TaxID=208348 RepID=A0A180GFY8_PUCT1|nr:hypothetical protein PTTG_27910 [Puccinia triticina 1-1 BBBD Race 1]WAR58624.1 hypothetical protein PtB15_5B859 [Puccinia triticina]